MPVGGNIDFSKWQNIEVEDDAFGDPEPDVDAEAALQATYAREVAQDGPQDKLQELKIMMAVDNYEKRRPADRIMHHYVIKDAGDPEAIGEYFQTGDERNDAPVYRNKHGLVISREKQPVGVDTDEECYGWVIGNMVERRPLYGVVSDDLSIPTLNWQPFTAPLPVPVLRYYTPVSAARHFKERGNRAFQKRDWAEAEEWYTKSLGCKMDPKEFAEPYGMLHSNRAEVRLRVANFTGAVEDADTALKYLRTVSSDEGPTGLLKQKTAIRLAKAFQGLKRFSDAARLLQEQRRYYPNNKEFERLNDELQLAMKAESRASAGKASATGGATEEMLSFVAKTVEALQAEVAGAGAGAAASAAVFSQPIAEPLKKLEYLLAKAQSVEGGCLADLQGLMRTCGGMRVLLQLLQAQWRGNLDGKLVDVYKLPAAASVAVALALCCDKCPENLRLVAAEAHGVFSVLGGCNQKVEKEVCEKLVRLASGLWEHCRATSVDLVQQHSIVVERAASFMSRAVLSEPADDIAGHDAPGVSAAARDEAAMLLFELLGAGGRIEKRALRGMVPHLANPDGEGFFTAEQEMVRSLGRFVVTSALNDPSLASAPDVKHMLTGANLLVMAGVGTSADDQGMACIAYDGFGNGNGAVMRYFDMDSWDETEDGQHASLLLELASRVLEFRLAKKDRELDRDNFESAFHLGMGFFITIPLVQGPPAFAEHALRCLAALVQANPSNVDHIVGLSTVHALMSLPTPEEKPMPSCVAQTLKTSVAARKHAAKVLSRCVETQVMQDLLHSTGDKSIKELVKLATAVREDGKGNLESFHDMMHVFYIISQVRPGPLCRYVTADMMNLFAELSLSPEQNVISARASAIVEMLQRDPHCAKVLEPALNRGKAGAEYDAEDELLALKPGTGAAIRME